MIKRLACTSVCLLLCTHVQAYLDNQMLFPFHTRITWRTSDKLSQVSSSLFFMTAHAGRDCYGNPIDIAEMGGCFDLAKLNKAMNLVGITNPLFLSEWSTSELPYRSFGKLRSTGVDFMCEYALSKKLSIGGALSLMHADGRYDYCPLSQAKDNLKVCNNGQIYPGQEFALERARLNANALLGINPGQWSDTGFSDLEVFVRYGHIKEYWLKNKQLDINGLVGVIFPTAPIRAINAPAAVALGGDGHLGFYAQFEVAAELTDDVFLGGWLYACKRLAKTQMHRMPMDCEPLNYGVLVASARVNPGATVGFSPYVIFDDLQDGFGAYGSFTFLYHFCDGWTYTGPYTPRLNRIGQESQWINEYFTLGIDYDSTKSPSMREYGPTAFFEFTLPANIFVARRVAKNYRISLGVAFHF